MSAAHARPRRRRRRTGRDRVLQAIATAAVAGPLGVLALLFGVVAWRGLARLDWLLLTGAPSRHAEQAGLLPALAGSALLVVLVAALSVPVGVGAAVYFEEYGHDSRLARLLELNVKNLAGVPSVVYGVLGLGVFVRALDLGRSLIAGAATLSLLVLPIVIVASREALRVVPAALRESGLALGATRWRTTWGVVLPAALPGVATSVILALSRALGETAPLVVVGALTYVTFLPDGLDAPYTALPIQIWSWVSRPQPEFIVNAAAGVVVLLTLLAVTNAAVVILRDRAQRRVLP